MTSSREDLQKTFQQYDDNELLDIYLNHKMDYTDEALSIIRTILIDRGLTDLVLAKSSERHLGSCSDTSKPKRRMPVDELWYELTEEGQRARKRIIIFKYVFMLLSIVLFLIGFFNNIGWLSILGGCLIVTYDILDMLAGFLKPLFPIIFAIILAFAIEPWYMGVLWASAVWHIIGIPWYIWRLNQKE